MEEHPHFRSQVVPKLFFPSRLRLVMPPWSLFLPYVWASLEQSPLLTHKSGISIENLSSLQVPPLQSCNCSLTQDTEYIWAPVNFLQGQECVLLPCFPDPFPSRAGCKPPLLHLPAQLLFQTEEALGTEITGENFLTSERLMDGGAVADVSVLMSGRFKRSCPDQLLC